MSLFFIKSLLRAYPKRINIITMGACQSSAIAVLQAGDKRLAYPHTFFWLHQGKYSLQEQRTIDLLHTDLADYEMQENTYMEILSSRASIAKEEMKKMCISEYGFSAQEAIRLGLVDELVTHK